MKIALFAATSSLGREIIERAIPEGHSITALVRRPEAMVDLEEKFNGEQKRLETHKVDVFSVDSVASHLTGCDAVISCIGPHYCFTRAKPNLMLDSIRTIVESMKKHDIKRLIMCSALGSECDPNPTLVARLDRWLYRVVMPGLADNFTNAEKFLMTSDEAKDIDFTILKLPHLRDLPMRDHPPPTHEGHRHRSGLAFHPSIPRVNVAKFMLDEITSDKWSRKMVAIAY